MAGLAVQQCEVVQTVGILLGIRGPADVDGLIVVLLGVGEVAPVAAQPCAQVQQDSQARLVAGETSAPERDGTCGKVYCLVILSGAAELVGLLCEILDLVRDG